MKPERVGPTLALLLLMAVATPAWPAGVISGRLVNKTPGGQSVGGVEVVLAREDGADQDERRTRTDAKGGFRFEGVPTGADRGYRLTVRYQGAEYTATLGSRAVDGADDIVIPVWDGTADPGTIRVVRHHLVLDGSEQGMKVQEVMVVRNDGDRTFVGSRPVPGDRRATLEFTLPRGYAELSYGDGLMECCVVPTEQGFADTMDIKPGTREVTFGYRLEPKTEPYRLLRRLDYPTEEVDVFISPAALAVSSASLSDRGRISGEGREYLRWGRTRLAGGALLAVDLAGLPRTNFLWKGLVYGAVAALLAGGLAYPFIRRRRGATARVPAVTVSPGLELDLRKAELVAGLAALDEQHEAGRIPEADYQTLRTRKKAALTDVMRALGRLGGAASHGEGDHSAAVPGIRDAGSDRPASRQEPSG